MRDKEGGREEMGKYYLVGRLGKEKIREERVRLIVKLRDEQHLTFSQIAAQVGMGEGSCSEIYHWEKGGKK